MKILMSLFFTLLSSSLFAQNIEVVHTCEFFGFRGKVLNLSSKSHSFIQCTMRDLQGNILESFHISWIPQDPYIRPGLRMPAFGDVPGQNLSIPETVSRGLENNRVIESLGVHLMHPQAYEDLKLQSQKLNCGQLQYRGLDSLNRDGSRNCRNAIRGALGLEDMAIVRGPGATAKMIRDFSEAGAIQGQVAPGYKITPTRRFFQRLR